ncbi:MAG: thiamine pyrophosphate-requiring protein [Alphaproteobacteria bacterium]|nr:thiamine pyrophosphate-requiring protein [Alphaproteobacteria bacterium]
MAERRIAADTAGEALLGLMAARGIDCLFANSGTDFPSIIEALARPRADGARLPRPVLCAHETVAVGMAHGHAMVSSRAQAVMVHVNVGAANALAGLFNAAREFVPMLFCMGRTPIFEAGAPGARSLNIHWAQEMFDQAGMLREAVKWDYELRDPAQIETVLDRALALARSEPCAPVALTLPREVLARALPGFAFAEPTRQATASPAAPDPAAIEAIATALAAAERPLVITASAGRDGAVPGLLADLATRFALRVVEYRPRYHSLDNGHPMHGGFEVDPYLAEADAILVLECDVPWIPAARAPRPDARIFHLGPDPLFARYPVRSFAAEVAAPAAARLALPSLAAALERHAAPRAGAIAARGAALAVDHAARRDAAIRAAEAIDDRPGMSMAWASLCLSRALPADAIVVNEYPLVRPAMNFSCPGTFFGSSPVGGLGWGLPAALGAQMAAPDRLVVAAQGDGSYVFTNPVACHQVAAAERLPVLTVVFDNGGWGAVRRATLAMYPQGHAARAEVMPLTGFSPAPDYPALVRACGGWGERVERARDLPAALERALAVVREEKRQALLSLACR